MIVWTDPEYKDTKLIKSGVKVLARPFDELAAWISKTREVKVLNIIYDLVFSDDRPRLQVVLEYEEDCQKFKRGQLGNYKESEQNDIRKKFTEIVQRSNLIEFTLEKLFVVFSAFEPIAIEEIHSSLSETTLGELRKKLKDFQLWKIRPSFGSVTFFFETESQIKSLNKKEAKQQLSKKYMKLVKPFDEFGYLNEDKLIVHIDSKEHFDTAYKGSWFNYDR